MRLAYDGTDFAGYQIQRGQNVRTVQGVIEKALASLHGAPVATACAGRTDTGVHALGQYVSFDWDHPRIPEQQFAAALNSRLPPDVRATNARFTADGFHARYSACQRHYRYYLYTSQWDLPHRRRYAWRLPDVPELSRMNAEAAQLVGTHDFSTFAARRRGEDSMTRTVTAAAFYADNDEQTLEFRISADGFLWRMVRSIVGTLVGRERDRRRGRKSTSAMSITEMLERRDRSLCGTLAPPRGLFLYDVEYP